MGLQFIFVVETNKKSNTDFMYIVSAVNHFYSIGSSDYKLSPVYMGGKGNYASKATLRDVVKKQKDYVSTSDKNKSVVLYCFDCDNYDTDPQDKEFLENVESYCQKNGYKFIWFCKDIEHVFLGKRIPANQKGDEAEKFIQKSLINKISIDALSVTQYKNKSSNFCIVLDGLFPESAYTNH